MITCIIRIIRPRYIKGPFKVINRSERLRYINTTRKLIELYNLSKYILKLRIRNKVYI
jgi:hypothetical protein